MRIKIKEKEDREWRPLKMDEKKSIIFDLKDRNFNQSFNV